jgi:hypothetical protein
MESSVAASPVNLASAHAASQKTQLRVKKFPHSCKFLELLRPVVRSVSFRRMQQTVILHESGVSSTPKLCDSITAASEYWVPAFQAV